MNVLPDTIVTLLHQEIDRRGLTLLELKRRGQRNTTVVEVIVDSEQGVGIDELAELNRWIGALLDEHEEAIAGRYRLEVSSAGLDRPLEHDWQYRKNIGRLLKLTYDDEAGRSRTDIYRLVGIDDTTLSLSPKATGKKGRSAEGEVITIPRERIRRAVIEVEF
jgi:ribosome maturation factor RimP